MSCGCSRAASLTFLTSLIPVVGVFIEGGFIVLVALNEYGLEKALWASGAIVIIIALLTVSYKTLITARANPVNALKYE